MVEAKIDGETVLGRIPIMKLLGAVAGLYPISQDHALLAMHTDRWLILADEFLTGEKSLDYVSRLLSTALSSSDFLASCYVPTAADIILSSVITDLRVYPNNVELWIKRLCKILN